jgi:hypothetical protein
MFQAQAFLGFAPSEFLIPLKSLNLSRGQLALLPFYPGGLNAYASANQGLDFRAFIPLKSAARQSAVTRIVEKLLSWVFTSLGYLPSALAHLFRRHPLLYFVYLSYERYTGTLEFFYRRLDLISMRPFHPSDVCRLVSFRKD